MQRDYDKSGEQLAITGLEKNKNPAPSGEGNDPPADVGVVLEVFGEVARVQPRHSQACDTCGAHSVCFPSGGGPAEVEVLNPIGAVAGDIVLLHRAEGPRIQAALLLFGVPVVCTLGGTLLGMNGAADATGGAVAGALAGLAGGMLVLYLVNKVVASSRGMKPVIREVVGHEAAETRCTTTDITE